MPKWLRYSDLVQRGTVNNRPQLKNLQENYGFPRGRLLGPNTRVWDEKTEVEPWEASRPTAPKPVHPLKPGKRRGRPRKSAATENSATA
jgi:hypothetical protein